MIKKNVFLLFLFIMPSIILANNVLYKRLNNLYIKDAAKCLEMSKKFMAVFPKQATPYYFASISYRDKSYISKTIKGRYLNLRKCLNYAMKFEKLKDDEISQLVNWGSDKKKIEWDLLSLINDLQLEKKYDMSQALINKMGQLKIESEIGQSIISSSSPLNKLERLYLVYLNAEDSKEFKQLCFERGVTIQKILNEVIKIYLNDEKFRQFIHSGGFIYDGLFKSYWKSYVGSGNIAKLKKSEFTPISLPLF